MGSNLHDSPLPAEEEETTALVHKSFADPEWKMV